jgi:hypothetical protein
VAEDKPNSRFSSIYIIKISAGRSGDMRVDAIFWIVQNLSTSEKVGDMQV